MTATCKERIRSEYKDTLTTVRKLWELYQQDIEASDPDYGKFDEYGLSFDYVAPGTFQGQRKGYWRWQLSWGGPSDEFRFYCKSAECGDFPLSRVEYWFMDWFDGAKVTMSGKNRELLEEIWEYFKECGSVQNALQES